MRDSQRSKVYKSERCLDSFNGGERYEKVADIERYLKKVVKQKWFQKRWPWVRFVQVLPGQGRSSACGGVAWHRQPYMKLPKWARTKLVIMHELAHGLTSRHAAHGREFCAVYLQLVHHYIGKEEAMLLKAAFRKNRVKYTQARTSPQQVELTCDQDLLVTEHRS